MAKLNDIFKVTASTAITLTFSSICFAAPGDIASAPIASNTQLDKQNIDGLGKAVSATAPNVDQTIDERLNLKLQLESRLDKQLDLLAVCKKTDLYTLSDLTLFIDYYNQVIAKNKSIKDGEVERDTPQKLVAIDQIRRSTISLEKLYASYKAYGGTEVSADLVTAVPNPCNSIENEIKSAMLQKAEMLRSEYQADTISPKSHGDRCKTPAYPSFSMRNREQGTTKITFLTDTDGSFIYLYIEKSSGYPFLDRSAIQSLKACKLSPFMLNGKPERAVTTVDYVWKLPE